MYFSFFFFLGGGGGGGEDESVCAMIDITLLQKRRYFTLMYKKHSFFLFDLIYLIYFGLD